jgi:ATP-dependent DNA helicase RecG
LFSDSENKTSLTRLNAIVQAKNGFELAEKDLQLRGPGEFFGNKQTGLPDIAMRSLQNPEEIQMSRELAATLFKSDPHFARHPLLKTKIEEVRRAVHQE